MQIQVRDLTKCTVKHNKTGLPRNRHLFFFFFSSTIRWWWWSGCYDQRTARYSNKVTVCENSLWNQWLFSGLLSFSHTCQCSWSAGQQCRRTEVMFCIGGSRMESWNWNCRAPVPVAPVPLLLWRMESKTCCSFMSQKLSQWSRWMPVRNIRC